MFQLILLNIDKQHFSSLKKIEGWLGFVDYEIIKKYLNLDLVKKDEDYWGNKTKDAKFWISKGTSGISGFEISINTRST